MPWADGSTSGRPASVIEGLVVNEFAGGIIGTGDAQQMYNATTAQFLAVKDGTAAAPDTSLNPLIKVERTINIAAAAIGGDGAEQCAGLVSVVEGTAACEVQGVGLAGFANTSSTVSTTADACGIYGVGKVKTGGIGGGIGGFFLGRVDSAAGRACGAEIDVGNYSGSAHSVVAAGASVSKALWMNSVGTSRAAVGIQLGNAFGSQFDVGVHFNAQVAGGFTGPTLTNDIRSDSTSATAIKINGTHATAAIHVASGSGKVMVGATTETWATALLEVMKLTGSADPIASFRVAASDGSTSISIGNGAGSAKIWTAGAVNNFLTGTVAGDHGINVSTAAKAFHLGGTTKVVTVTNANTLGFHAATPIAKPTGWGAPTGTPTRTTFATSTVTLAGLAERVKALIDDLTSYGLIGA